MNKRGEESSKEMLALAILTIAAVALFLTWQLGVFEKGEKDTQETLCRQSITFHSTAVRISGEKSAPPIECEPRSVSIDNKNETTTYKALAKEFAFCWERWQEGEVELFDEAGIYCNPCSVIAFSEKGQVIDDYEAILSQKYKGNLTYEDFLFPHRTEEYSGKGLANVQSPIDTDKQYAVVFYHDKNYTTKSLKEAFERDPARAAPEALKYGPWAAVGAGIGAGVGLLASVACIIGTEGACAAGSPVIMTASAAGGSAVVGGIIGLVEKDAKGVDFPDWFSVITIVPNEGEAYKALGCTNVSQKGVPELVDGAENI